MNKSYSFEDLVQILQRLRGENGCPWDREQTHETLKRYFVEETYEALEALDSGEMHKFADELGDVLLQIVFHAQIGNEMGTFSIQDVLDCVCQKMVDRHPHVFGTVVADTSEEVLQNWEDIKKKERGQKSNGEILKGISKGLPALLRADKVLQKIAKWEEQTISYEETMEEILRESQKGKDASHQELLMQVIRLYIAKEENVEMSLHSLVDQCIQGYIESEKAK